MGETIAMKVERERRRGGEARGGLRAGQALRRDRAVVDGEDGGDDGALERGVGPVVHRPRPQLLPVESDAGHSPDGAVRSASAIRYVLRAIHSRISESTTTQRVAVARHEILARKRGERRLDARRAAEPMTRPRTRRRAARRPSSSTTARSTAALGQREALPGRSRRRPACSASRRCSVSWRCSRPTRFARAARDIVPGLVREALNVVGQVPGQIERRRRRSPGSARMPVRTNRDSMNAANRSAGSSRGASPDRPCRTAAAVRSSAPSASARSRRRRSRPGADAAPPRAALPRRCRR